MTIIWEEDGAEIDRRVVPEGASEIEALIEMVRAAGDLRDGDVIRVVVS